MTRLRAALLAVTLLLPALPGAAEEPSFAITGQVQRPASLTPAQLRAMPATTIELPNHARVTGVLLLTLLEAAGPVTPTPRHMLQHTLLATGRDGYAVALSIGELLPDFAGKPALIAYEQDGAPLPALRLVVPGDNKAGRFVRDVVSVELR